MNWIDYPLYIQKVDTFSIYFFFCLYINIYFFGQNLRKKYYLNLYNNYSNLNFLKEYILKNEIL
jgi:hypothetical protein